MKLYNTLTKQIEDLTPLQEDAVRIYSCGPTVYDHVHIGNLSAFIYADTLRRALQAHLFKVQHVMNFTDVDDKTIRRSREKHPDLEPRAALSRLTEEYTAVFLADTAAIGNDTKTVNFVKATDSIADMQQLVKQLFDSGFAYIADDGVYFSIAKYRSSGKKYGQLVEITDSNTSQARIQNDEYDKESAHDFALWKKQKPGEPGWDFELDGQNLAGRPGWHIECSAMSQRSLGLPFDIHTGGIDLAFPHHENEISQSTAGQSNPSMAQLFFHNEHLLVDGKKMSKSLKNFYTLKDITNKGYDPLAFRVMVLQSHYRSQANFTWEGLEAAANRLKTYRDFADLVWQPSPSAPRQNMQHYLSPMLGALTVDDINTPEALKMLSRAAGSLGEAGPHPDDTQAFNEFLAKVDDILGLGLSGRPDIDMSQKQLLSERQAARENKDWSVSDRLRDELKAQGLEVRDTAAGQIWSRL